MRVYIYEQQQYQKDLIAYEKLPRRLFGLLGRAGEVPFAPTKAHFDFHSNIDANYSSLDKSSSPNKDSFGWRFTFFQFFGRSTRRAHGLGSLFYTSFDKEINQFLNAFRKASGHTIKVADRNSIYIYINHSD